MKPYLRPASVPWLEAAFPDRPHPLPPRHTYYAFFLDGIPVGYVGLGYGLQQAKLLPQLFSCPIRVSEYREITRSYCRPDFKNAPSQMLGTALRLLRKQSQLRLIYTTGAGYQGLTGRIYQAANFIYAGAFMSYVFFIPGIGYVHSRSFTERYRTSSLRALAAIYPGIRKRIAPIFRYVYPLDDSLMQFARFKRQSNPMREDVRVLEVFADGSRNTLLPAEAYAPIASLRTRSRLFPKQRASVVQRRTPGPNREMAVQARPRRSTPAASAVPTRA